MKELAKQYNPSETEDRIYAAWETSGAFTADAASSKEAYVISMPPPNATGRLHVGHALGITLQDILIRVARMQGKEALYVPGTDHAAIATENVVIKELKKKGIKNPREELGREKLLEEIKAFVVESQGDIRSQIRKMGASCDWSRERYTMDPALSRLVVEVFVKMYEDKLIYRDYRIVNWDPALQTNVSDDEVEHKKETTTLYTFQYGPFTISTARPETKFGDKYVVMHPSDARYKQYNHGDTFTAEWINGPVEATVVKDESIDPEFGTGVMTITPWHDVADFEIAKRHNLSSEQIIDFNGKLLPIAGEFTGLHITEARDKVVKKLEEKGLLVERKEGYEHNIAVNSRGGGVIEPQIRLQWFIDVNKKALTWGGESMSLKEIMRAVVDTSEVEIIPSRFTGVYMQWIDNLHDWCISRQIWWGHQIPAWYKGEETYVGRQAPEGEGWIQDSDTLDTWFSSGLWTWSTLVDPILATDASLSLKDLLERSPDVKKFHPTTVLETAYDILFFWVARMILMTTYATGEVPFKHVFLHGLVLTKAGKKMSKSDPSTAIDPLKMIEAYGADALRFGLVYGMGYDNQAIKLDEVSIQSGRNFANKMWNIARLLLTLEDREEESLADQWIREELQRVSVAVTEYISEYKFGEAARALYSFVWRDFADWYIEIVKSEGSPKVAKEVYMQALTLLHPYMPFVTEELYGHLSDGISLMQQAWPSLELPTDPATSLAMNKWQQVVLAVRSARKMLGIKDGALIEVVVEGMDMFLPNAFTSLTKSSLVSTPENSSLSVTFPIGSGASVTIASSEITTQSLQQSIERLQKRVDQEEQNMRVVQGIVENMKKGNVSPEKIADRQQTIEEGEKNAGEMKLAMAAIKKAVDK